MKEQYAAELESGARVDSVFAIRASEVRLARTGEPYLWMELADRTGAIEAVRFRIASQDAPVPVGSVARVRGTVSMWRGGLSVRVSALEPADSYDRGDLMPTTPQDTVALRRRLNQALASIGDRPLRALVHRVFADPGLAARFAECPASVSGHHAYLGGLLEHTVAVVDAGDRLARCYPSVDRNLLTAAALLHDIGMVDALEFDTSVELSDRGRLLGHVNLGLARLESASASAGSKPGARRFAELAHAVAAHHADLGAEWGPVTLEALLLSTADALDARVASLVAGTSRATRGGADWSDGSTFPRPLPAPRRRPAIDAVPGYLRAAG